MPRIIDKLDLAAGRVPEELDTSVDYLEQRPSPAALIRPDGTYEAGWFERFDGALNFQDSRGLGLAFQRWHHLTFDTPGFFVVANIADLTKAGNVALLVVDKATGRLLDRSRTRLYPSVSVEISDDLQLWREPETGSFIRVSPDLTELQFSVRAGDVSVTGVARTALGPPLVQVTGFQRARGSLQWFGCLEVVQGALTFDDAVHRMPPGTLGTFDRTAGHQRGLSAWNWVSGAGLATDRATGEQVRLGLMVARDRARARPRVNSCKYAVWFEDRLVKLPSAAFHYQLKDPDKRETGLWLINSPESQGDGLDLTFTPRFHRREEQHLWVVEADFNQYYGELSGTVIAGGRTFDVDDWFVVTEESLFEL